MNCLSTSKPLLELRNLSVGFRGLPIISDVSLTINEGEKVSLVGESGSGKSMTALSILRLLPVGADILGGSILFEGQDIAKMPQHAVRALRGKRIALIQQEPMTSLNPVMSIGAQVSEMLLQNEVISKKEAQERTIELLDLVGITKPRERYAMFPHNFSGGMRQRVVIAMAIACNPRLLIADEPTTALDVTTQAQVMDLIENLCAKLSMSMLLITHDLGVVAQWSDNVAVMYAGRIVERAPVQSFFSNYAHPYSKGLLGSSIGLGWHYTRHRLTEIKGNIDTAIGERGCRFAPRCSQAIGECATAEPVLTGYGKDCAVACYNPIAHSETKIHSLGQDA